MKHFLLILICNVAIVSCTIAPSSTPVPKVSSTWARENIIGYNSTGLFVRKDWIRAYHALLTTYGNQLPIVEQVSADSTEGIASISPTTYHITWQVNKRFIDLKTIEADKSP